MMKVWQFNPVAIVAMMLAAGCSSSRQSQGPATPAASVLWQARPLTIDGSDRDWIKPLPHSIRDENVSYSISNDAQNLYILLSTANRQEQQKIIQGGMSVWVNTKGDKTNGDAVGIGYPLNEHNDPDRKLMEEAQPQRYQKKPVTLEDKKTYALYGFSKDSSILNYTYGDNNPASVVMRMDYNNNGELIYEAAIPLQTLYPGHDPSTPYPVHDLAVGIFIEPLPMGSYIPREGGGGGSGVGFGVGGGMGGFGSGVGLGIGIGREFGAGGSRKPGRTLFDEAQIWQVVQLARK
ncbi:MAG TPA: hypothetical protein VFE32_16850 [Puia sp.]|jgi:hypothetical protein|nr:hypothetical protein [Puia sp.]